MARIYCCLYHRLDKECTKGAMFTSSAPYKIALSLTLSNIFCFASRLNIKSPIMTIINAFWCKTPAHFFVQKGKKTKCFMGNGRHKSFTQVCIYWTCFSPLRPLMILSLFADFKRNSSWTALSQKRKQKYKS